MAQGCYPPSQEGLQHGPWQNCGLAQAASISSIPCSEISLTTFAPIPDRVTAFSKDTDFYINASGSIYSRDHWYWESGPFDTGTVWMQKSVSFETEVNIILQIPSLRIHQLIDITRFGTNRSNTSGCYPVVLSGVPHSFCIVTFNGLLPQHKLLEPSLAVPFQSAARSNPSWFFDSHACLLALIMYVQCLSFMSAVAEICLRLNINPLRSFWALAWSIDRNAVIGKIRHLTLGPGKWHTFSKTPCGF